MLLNPLNRLCVCVSANKAHRPLADLETPQLAKTNTLHVQSHTHTHRHTHSFHLKREVSVWIHDFSPSISLFLSLERSSTLHTGTILQKQSEHIVFWHGNQPPYTHTDTQTHTQSNRNAQWGFKQVSNPMCGPSPHPPPSPAAAAVGPELIWAWKHIPAADPSATMTLITQNRCLGGFTGRTKGVSVVLSP